MQTLIKKRPRAAGALVTLVVLLVSSVTLGTTATADENTPPAHYTQDCVACHVRMTGGEGETLYRRKDRMVNDYDALIARVEYCRRGTGADWNKLQTDEVVRYLNRRFYHFSPPR